MRAYDVDTIRIRVWNDPYSASGESYGAGGNDVATSLEIGRRVTAAGFGALLNFHYSDFCGPRQANQAQGGSFLTLGTGKKK